MELRIAQFLGLRKPTGSLVYRFQNYWINKSVPLGIEFDGSYRELPHDFLPFGFSGISIDRQGDLKEASLVLPNNALVRGWIDQLVQERWFVTVRTIMPSDPVDPKPDKDQILFTYVGVITTAAFETATITATVSTVLDAVGADAPTRRITRSVVGSIPTTSSVRLQ